MGKLVKISNVDIAKVCIINRQAGKTIRKIVSVRPSEVLVGALFLVIDVIRVRIGRKQDQKAFEKNTVSYQAATRKHEAEINVLREQANRSQDAKLRVDQLEKIVKDITEGGASELACSNIQKPRNN